MLVYLARGPLLANPAHDASTIDILCATLQIPVVQIHYRCGRAHGCARLQLNILVLQQNLKNIEPSTTLSRSASFYDMFTLGSERIVKQAKEQGRNMGFTNEQVTKLLKLVYSEALKSPRREISVAAERGLAQDELLLSEYLW